MAQLFYKYGTMASGKSIEILKVAHNYKQQNRRVLLATSSVDTRYGIGKITSRIGMESDAYAIGMDEDLSQLNTDGYAAILIDEAQFLTRKQVVALAKVVDTNDIPVMCFGLKNDFDNRLFEGSEALLVFADKISEMKTICNYCGHKATMNKRLSDSTEQIVIGGDDDYVPVCRRHYYETNL